MTPKDFISLYYETRDAQKAKAWYVEREACVKMFYEESIRFRYALLERAFTEAEVRAMLEAGEGRLLGISVILTDEPGIRLECA